MTIMVKLFDWTVTRIRKPLSYCLLILLASPSLIWGQEQISRNLKIALAKTPIQKGVDVDSVPAADAARCTLDESTQEIYGGKGFIARGPNNQILRMYIREGQGSHWTYFKNNQEVYREIDSNGDKRVDQFRWMGEAGMRWGLDRNQDGTIDSWKAISAEEVAQEAFEAFRTRDRARFLTLTLKNEDLQQLALGAKAQKKVVGSVVKLNEGIANALSAERSISKSTEFLNFGGIRPATVPKGKMGLSKDVIIYDHASAMFKNGNEIGVIQLGTIIKSGDSWRLAELPVVTDSETVSPNGGLFNLKTTSPPPPPPPNKLMEQFAKADNALKNAKDREEKERLHKQRFDIMLKLITAAEAEEKELWVKMTATDAATAFSNKEYSGGKKLLDLLAKSDITENYHDLFAWELAQLEVVGTEDNNLALLDAMEEFVAAYPESVHSKDAYRQLGLFSEFDSSPIETSLKWYKELTTRFPDSLEGRFAAGAIRRLTCLDEQLEFTGETFTKQKFNLAAYRGKRMVVLHFWSTVDELSLADFEELIALRAKYKDELSVIGINLDEQVATATGYLKREQPGAKWPHLWAEGGRDASPLALQLGIISVPTTIFINKRGEVVENQIAVSELDREIFRLKRRER